MNENEKKNPDLRKVGEISGHFFVPSYQRGYRWGRHEVEVLLNDIYVECGRQNVGEKYCLQPIVIKEKIAPDNPEEGLPPTGEAYYELIDGQQRLTTLYLIYLFLKKNKGVEPRFSLAYQTRPGSTNYLQNPTPDKNDDNIDYFYMYEAYLCIEEWFRNAAENTVDRQVMGVADDIYRYLRNQVHVIWYDAGTEDSISLFTRLNAGRIALTNAELVKALLLKSSGDSLDDKYRQIEISTQWDMIERDLQNDAFWAFLTNQPVSNYPTRIELLFDLLAQKAEEEKDRFFTFLYFRDYLDRQNHADAKNVNDLEGKKGTLAVWASVLDLYHLLREWFDCRYRYHKVGYLIATGDNLGELVKIASGDEGLTKTGFLSFLDKRISERLDLDEATARSLDYLKNYDACERLLLLFNVETVCQLKHSKELYPFNSHKDEGWSLEHIHAQNADPMKTEEEWRSWLIDSMESLKSIPRLDQDKEIAKSVLVNEIDTVLAKSRVERKDFEPLVRRTMEFLDAEDTNEGVHSIVNLALLSGKVNSSLNNAAFQAKRLRIINLDHKGEFIPLCTRRVFLKYYTQADSQQLFRWSREDQDSYLNAMLASPDSKVKRAEGVVWKYLKKSATEILS